MPLALDSLALNPQQREAVAWPGGPLLIFAGAGSGKTRVITCRIARLVDEGVHPSRILAVTFTNKAAREMTDRVQNLLGASIRGMWIGTFHSMASRLLRIEGEQIGLARSFTIYDDSDQLALAKACLKEHEIDEKTLQPRTLINRISTAKERLVGPEAYAKDAHGFVESMVAKLYPLYQKKLAAANALDFDDLIMQAVRVLDECPAVREKYAERFQHVLVDEYQDVNYAQYRLTHLIAAGHANITVVGDDDQSIYAWRGADVALMLRFSSDYPGAKIITLAQNYRSTPNILRAAHHVIQHNRSRSPKELWTDNETGAPVTVTETPTEGDEALLVADYVQAEVAADRRAYGDFAVLYRTNAQSRALEEAFLTMRVPHVLIGGQRFYERKEIRDMLAYLRVVLNPSDTVSLRRILNVPARGIGASAIGVLEEATRAFGSLWDALRDPGVQQTLSRGSQKGVRSFVAVIEDAQFLAEEGPVTPVLRHVMSRSGYHSALAAERTEEAQSRVENLQELVNVTAQYDEADLPTLAGFLENVALISDPDLIEDTRNAVTLMTLHASKGLEFPVVFLCGLEEGLFPHGRSLGSEAELEEERRLCYVGMTRAREVLHLTHARRRRTFGQESFSRSSRFLEDLPGEEVATLPNANFTFDRPNRFVGLGPSVPSPIAGGMSSREPSWTAPFGVGQRVRHPTFGEGVVVACGPLRDDSEVTVAFPGQVGVKKLVQSKAKLERA